MRKAADLGVSLFNSASIYVGPTGHNEELLGKAFSGDLRSKVFISTKFGVLLPTFAVDLAPASIRGHCDAALSRLNTSYIDLFICCRMSKACHPLFLVAPCGACTMDSM